MHSLFRVCCSDSPSPKVLASCSTEKFPKGPLVCVATPTEYTWKGSRSSITHSVTVLQYNTRVADTFYNDSLHLTLPVDTFVRVGVTASPVSHHITHQSPRERTRGWGLPSYQNGGRTKSLHQGHIGGRGSYRKRVKVLFQYIHGHGGWNSPPSHEVLETRSLNCPVPLPLRNANWTL